ncbi:hypothetical protein JK358_25655 [Nocardia sp. 2]|uniref:Cell division protein FtsL n=1 Tax=Nocardia acididurans TaxID=2802282 RepID=A0ABS1MAX2_9NOCA|nr:hypothetical protein [Nocardia acididurans]MBL1077793.1 hypothetical protein [Nocardia acididurans]
MTIRTPARTAQPKQNRGGRRVEAAEKVKSGAAQRAYARRRSRESGRVELPPVLRRSGEPMARGRMGFVAGIIALLGCGLALTLLLTTRATEDSYQLGAERAANQKLIDEKAALQREVEAADSAPELAQRAAELGMIPAKDPARLVIGPDGSVTVVGNPQPAQGSPAAPLNTTPPAPSAAPPQLAQAQGERVLPASPPTTAQNPNPAPGQQNPAGQNNQAGQNNPAGQNPATQNGGQPNPAAQNPVAPNPAGDNPAQPNPADQNPAVQNAAGDNPAQPNPAAQNANGQNPAQPNPAAANPAGTDPAQPNAGQQNPAGQNPAAQDGGR